MTSIIYIGMDVHTTNYTLCCYTVDSDDAFAVVNVKPDYHEILKYMERVRSTRGGNCDFICGYEAGCLGYSLYHQLAKHGVACIILAPSTMPQQKGKSIKTDKRDAKNIAKCLAFNLYSPVYVPTAEDDAIKEYIRMRDDVKADLKRTKQQIISFCTRHGFHYEGKSRWTQAYFKWLDSLVFENALYKETLQEYLALYCGATSFLRNSDKIYEKKRNASQAPGRRFWPSAAARTRTRSWRPLWTRWWPPGSLIVRSVGWRWTTRPTPCDCYCSKWGGM